MTLVLVVLFISSLGFVSDNVKDHDVITKNSILIASDYI